jgi:hypothetical protein
MSERKVLTKYIPPDFDPRVLSKRVRSSGPAKLPTVRLMTPFSMKCTRCGTYIPKSRTFNARKETPKGDAYLGIQKYRFYFHCPGCHGEVAFKTDPKNMDYEVESGAVRNFEPWREGRVEESDEERLRRLEMEAGGEDPDVDAMADMEAKLAEAQTDMAVADALDEIRANNARQERAAKGVGESNVSRDEKVVEREREEKEDEEAARDAFQKARDWETQEEEVFVLEKTTAVAEPKSVLAQPVPSFKKTVKVKKNLSAALGIKKKVS